MEKAKISNLLGEYGEQYCALRLMSLDYEVYKNWVSDGVDLLVVNKNRIRRVQVKCCNISRIGNQDYYTFQIKRKRSKKIYEEADFFIFLGVGENFEIVKMWKFPRKMFDDEYSGTLNININSKKYKKFENKWVIG